MKKTTIFFSAKFYRYPNIMQLVFHAVWKAWNLSIVFNAIQSSMQIDSRKSSSMFSFNDTSSLNDSSQRIMFYTNGNSEMNKCSQTSPIPSAAEATTSTSTTMTSTATSATGIPIQLHFLHPSNIISSQQLQNQHPFDRSTNSWVNGARHLKMLGSQDAKNHVSFVLSSVRRMIMINQLLSTYTI